MNSESKLVKCTLSSKLTKRNEIVKPKPIIKAERHVLDIEDVPGSCTGSTSRYFSPVQTRKQRQVSLESKINVPAKKVRSAINKLEDSKVTKITVGSATVIKCEIVPKANELELNIGTVKTELNFPKVNWLQQLENVRFMRAVQPAPVDTMGCHQCADKSASEKIQRFQILVALMLSSQTKDEKTFEAMNRLKAQTLTPVSLQEMPIDVLVSLLQPVCFYRNKARHLKQTVKILIDKYNEDIPDNIPELLKLPGVGPKMAHICMATAWKQVTGIGVDTHVHRIANRLGWLKEPTKDPEKTRIGLESWLPRDLWAEVNHLFVGFGQNICTPLKPNCSNCLNNNICPASKLADNKNN